MLLSTLARLRSAVKRWSVETRFIPFVLIWGFGLFGGSITASFIIFDLVDGTLNSHSFVRVIEVWPIAGLFSGSATWLYLRAANGLAQRLSRGK